MLAQEKELIDHLVQLADCLRPHDEWWPNTLHKAASEAAAMFQCNTPLESKFDFLNRHNYSTGGMGSLNDGVVPAACRSQQLALYKTISELFRLYWKELGCEWHEYSSFNTLAEGTKVHLIPGKLIFRDGISSAVVQDDEARSEQWMVLSCNGPDITNMPSYTIRRGNCFRSARHEALEVVD